jgi:flagellar M-ring protein FliF
MTDANVVTVAQTVPMAARLAQGASMIRSFMRQPAVMRAAPMILVAAIIAVGLIAILLLKDPAYVTLFPQLEESDKAQVLQTLTDKGIKARLDTTTGQMTVPRADFYKAKMLLASAGLPKASASGYDILGQMPLGTSRSVESAKLRQAQETELARSIMEIRDIESARVHLAVPERSAFVRDQAPPSASVVLKLAVGRALGPGQVQSIVHLVSSSVAFMPVENVTVVDQFGNLLSAPKQDTDIGLTSQQLDHKMRVEKVLRERIMNLLVPIVGAGNVNSEINVDLDFTRTEQTNELFDPQQQVVRSQQDSLQESAEGRARGVPGATSNQPPPAPSVSNQQSTEQSALDQLKNRSSSSVKNFEVSREVKSVRAALGEVKHLSVAVVLRSQMTTDADGKPIEKQMTDDERTHLTELVQEAVGFSAERGDKVALIQSTFAQELPAVERSWYDAPWLEDAIKELAVLAILAIIVLGALRPFLTRLMTMSDVVVSGAEQTIGDGETVEVREGETLEEIKARLKPKKAGIDVNLLDTANTYDDKIALIRMLVGDDSGRVTAVLKSLIAKDIQLT